MYRRFEIGTYTELSLLCQKATLSFALYSALTLFLMMEPNFAANPIGIQYRVLVVILIIQLGLFFQVFSFSNQVFCFKIQT